MLLLLRRHVSHNVGGIEVIRTGHASFSLMHWSHTTGPNYLMRGSWMKLRGLLLLRNTRMLMRAVWLHAGNRMILLISRAWWLPRVMLLRMRRHWNWRLRLWSRHTSNRLSSSHSHSRQVMAWYSVLLLVVRLHLRPGVLRHSCLVRYDAARMMRCHALLRWQLLLLLILLTRVVLRSREPLHHRRLRW